MTRPAPARGRLGTMIALGGYAVASIALTWPLVLRLDTAVPGIRGDQATFLWGIDTWWREVLAGRVPLWTDRIFHPEVFPLWETTSVPLLALGAPPGVPRLAYYGVVAMAALAAAGLGMSRLLRELDVPAVPAFVGGLLWLTAPAVLDGVHLAHLTGLAAGLFPWGMLAIERLRRGVTVGRVAGAAAVVVALAGLTAYVTVLFVVMGGVLLWARAPRLALAGTVVGAGLVLAWPEADLTDLHRGLTGAWKGGARGLERLVDVGAVTGILALIGVLTAPVRRAAPYVVAGLGAWLLAAGWTVRWGTTILLEGPWTPWGLLMRWPPLTLLDTPNRMVLGVGFASVVLAGLAMGRVRRTWILGLAAVALAWRPVPLYTPPVPAVVGVLAAEPEDGTLLMLPGGFSEGKGGFGYQGGTNNEAMYWQTLHGKRRIGGHVSRQRHSRYARALGDPVLGPLLLRYQNDYASFHGLQMLPVPPITPAAWRAFVRRYDVRWIWLLPEGQRDHVRAELRALAPDARERELEGHVLLTLR